MPNIYYCNGLAHNDLGILRAVLSWEECRNKKVSAPSRRRDVSLDIPFYRTSPVSVYQALGRTQYEWQVPSKP